MTISINMALIFSLFVHFLLSTSSSAATANPSIHQRTLKNDVAMEFGEFRLLEEKTHNHGPLPHKKHPLPHPVNPKSTTSEGQLLLRKADNMAELIQHEDNLWWELLESQFSNSYPSKSHSPKPSFSRRPTSIPTPNPSSPTKAPATNEPTAAPTLSPTATTAPTVTLQPSVSLNPNEQPRSTPVPTFDNARVVFTCNENGIALADPPFDVFTIVDLKVGYLIETDNETSLVELVDRPEAGSNDGDAAMELVKPLKVGPPPVDLTLNGTNDGSIIPAVEILILGQAATGSLKCDQAQDSKNKTAADFFPLLEENGTSIVPMSTVRPGDSCQPEFENTVCTALETVFRIVIDEAVDPALAAFLGYVRLQEEMDGGSFLPPIQGLRRVKYLSPLPLLPPIVDDTTASPTLSPSAAQSNLSISPWTLGAVIATCIGGLVALSVWVRNRRTRNERHMQLLEDVSLSSPQSSMIPPHDAIA